MQTTLQLQRRCMSCPALVGSRLAVLYAVLVHFHTVANDDLTQSLAFGPAGNCVD